MSTSPVSITSNKLQEDTPWTHPPGHTPVPCPLFSMSNPYIYVIIKA